MSFCFVHAADLHLDTPFSGIEAASSVIAEQLTNISLDAFDRLIDFTIDNNALFLLLSGGIYDNIGLRGQLHFIDCMKRLDDKGVKVFLARGDKDPREDAWSAVSQWPKNVKIFSSSKVEKVHVSVDDEVVATIYGISHASTSDKRNLVLHFKPEGDDEGLRIGLLHGNTIETDSSGSLAPCSIRQLERVGMDYWALGNDHLHTTLRKGDKWIVYPGTLQGRSPSYSEIGPKGAVLAEVSPQGIERADFAPLDVVRFIEIDIDASSINDIDALKAEMLRRANRIWERNKDRNLIVRTYIKGAYDPNSVFWSMSVLDQLLDSLRLHYDRGKPFIWWESIHNCYGQVEDNGSSDPGDGFFLKISDMVNGYTENWPALDQFIDENTAPLRDAINKNLAGSIAPSPSQEEKVMLLKEAHACLIGLLRTGGQQ